MYRILIVTDHVIYCCYKIEAWGVISAWSFFWTDFGDQMISPSRVSRFVEDAAFGYQDFARRGEDNPPTFRAQVL